MAETANDNDSGYWIGVVTRSPEETAAVADTLARVLRGGDVVSLEGDLGAGKTFFAGAVARALGAEGHVTSPTFVLQKHYQLREPHLRLLAHYDVYRLADYSELADIGFEDLDGQALAMVEWGDRFRDKYAQPPVRVRFTVTGAQTRRIAICFSEIDRFETFSQALKERFLVEDVTRPELPSG